MLISLNIKYFFGFNFLIKNEKDEIFRYASNICTRSV